MKRIVGISGRESASRATAGLTLSFDRRRRSRLRARLDGGEEVAVVLPRGTVLEDGDVLVLDDDRLVRVNAAAEVLSRATSADPLVLARAAYHLGNRHIPVQVGPGFLAYQHDHVLDDMVRGLGLTVAAVEAPFEPESGAYGHGHGHGGRHSHDDDLGDDHDHGHDHGHDHDHDHDHDHETK
jgi:urease accessory protein